MPGWPEARGCADAPLMPGGVSARPRPAPAPEVLQPTQAPRVVRGGVRPVPGLPTWPRRRWPGRWRVPGARRPVVLPGVPHAPWDTRAGARATPPLGLAWSPGRSMGRGAGRLRGHARPAPRCTPRGRHPSVSWARWPPHGAPGGSTRHATTRRGAGQAADGAPLTLPPHAPSRRLVSPVWRASRGGGRRCQGPGSAGAGGGVFPPGSGGLQHGVRLHGPAGGGGHTMRGAVPTRPLTTHWSRRPTAFAPSSLRLLGAAHRGR